MSLESEQNQPLQDNMRDMLKDPQFSDARYEFDENHSLVRGNETQSPDFSAADFSDNFNSNPTL